MPASGRGHDHGGLREHGLTEPARIRGERPISLNTPDEFLAHVEEGLGTKNLIADAMLELTGRSYYANIGIDTVATIVNDLVTRGRCRSPSRCTRRWGTRPGLPDPRAPGLRGLPRGAGGPRGLGRRRNAGAQGDRQSQSDGSGRIGDRPDRPKTHRIVGDLADGDAIILLSSTGVQTNGLTLCRTLVAGTPPGLSDPNRRRPGISAKRCSMLRKFTRLSSPSASAAMSG